MANGRQIFRHNAIAPMGLASFYGDAACIRNGDDGAQGFFKEPGVFDLPQVGKWALVGALGLALGVIFRKEKGMAGFVMVRLHRLPEAVESGMHITCINHISVYRSTAKGSMIKAVWWNCALRC